MSSQFYRRLIIVLLAVSLIVSVVALAAASFLYGGRLVLALAGLILLIVTILVTVVFWVKYNNELFVQLGNQMGKIAAGNLGERLPVRTDDTQGKLVQAFNEMTVNLDWMVSRLSIDRSRLQTILTTMTDGVIVTDAEGKVVLSNPAAERFFGFRREDCPGCSLIQVVQEEEIETLLKKCIAEEKQQTIQFESRQAKQFFRIYAYPLITNRLTGVLLLF